jgi:hypothetical protein
MTLVGDLAIGLASGLALIAASLGFQIYRRALGKRRLSRLELRPNCLLTRYPIAFLSGRRSPFRALNYWNDIPGYLREHGYEVIVIEPPARGARLPALVAALEDLREPIHVVADSSLENEMRALAQSNHRSISSLTLIRNRNRTTDSSKDKLRPSVEDLKPLNAAIESFEISLPPDFDRKFWPDTVAGLLLLAHNCLSAPSWLLFRHTNRIDAVETGDRVPQNGWALEAPFLDLAISLAERDTRWSDYKHESI